MPCFQDTPESLELRARVVAAARAYYGVRYRHQGRTREHGLDCLGLAAAAVLDAGCVYVSEPDDDTYSLDPSGYYLKERMSAAMIELADWRDALPGDFVLQKWHVTLPPQHIGVVVLNALDDLRCVHSSRNARGVVENRWDRPELVTHAFRLREVAALMTEVPCG